MRFNHKLGLFLLIGLLAFSICAFANDEEKPKTVESKFPGLSAGPLSKAILADLDDVIFVSGEIRFTPDTLNDKIKDMDEETKKQLSKHQFFLLEQAATRELLTKEAKEWANENNIEESENLIAVYLDAIIPESEVTDEELVEYYEANKMLFGGAPLGDDLKASLRAYIKGQKKMEATDNHIRTLGSRHPIQISEAWAAEKYESWIKNPVETARLSGKPSFVSFGSERCAPCEMMIPIRAEIEAEYEDRLNMVYVNVIHEPIISAHYGISSIPVSVFFDKEGKEISRQLGYMDKEEVKKELVRIGLQ